MRFVPARLAARFRGQPRVLLPLPAPLLFLSLVLATATLLLGAGCNSSNPVAPDPPPSSAPAAYTVTLTASPATFTAGEATPGAIQVSVKRLDNGQPPPNGTQCAINTNLGSFGTDALGKPLTATSIELVGGAGSVNFFPGAAPGTARVLAQFETSFGQLNVAIQAATPMTFFLLSVEPASGGDVGGDSVTIHGGGFLAPVRVVFGAVVAEVVSVEPTAIAVRTPRAAQPLAVGETKLVDVEVTNAINLPMPMSDKLPGGFLYLGPGGTTNPPAILSVSPPTGSNEGGTRVTINGTGFEPPVQVFFGLTTGGSFEGAAATVVSATTTTITAVTPPATGLNASLANQTVDVQVRSTASGSTVTASGVFSYVGGQTLFVSSLEPRSGPYTGGTAVILRGRGFRGPLSVELGGTVQTLGTGAISGDGTRIDLTTVAVAVSACKPPSGAVRITLLGSNETATDPSLVFSYTAPPPFISTLVPTSGPQAGGNALTIQGNSFEAQVRVEVNDVAAPVSGVAAGGTGITVTAPAFTGQFEMQTCTVSGMTGQSQKPKAVDVEVTNVASGCKDTLAQGYTYTPTDTTCHVTPPAPPVADFTFQASGLAVAFNSVSTGSPTSFLWDFGDGGTSTLSSPSHSYADPGTYSVRLTVANAGGSNSIVKLVTVTMP